MNRHHLFILVLLLLAVNVHAGLWDSVTNLPGDIAHSLLDSIKQIVVDFVTPLLDLAKNFITSNPDTLHYQAHWQAVVTLISAFYLLIFLAVGFKFVVGSYDEVQRTEAKEWAKKAIFIVILVNASLLLYTLLLDVGSGTALYLWNNSYESMFQVQNLSGLNLILLVFFAIAVVLALITLFVRYLMVLTGIMAFPIGLFLYFLPPTQAYGKIILNTIGVVVFLQFVDVLALVASSLLLEGYANNQQMQLLAPTMGFLLIFILNVVLIHFAFLKAVADTGAHTLTAITVKQIAPLLQSSPQTKLEDFAVN